MARALANIPTSILAELLSAVEDGRLDAPLVWMQMQGRGFANCREAFEALGSYEREAVLAVLTAVIAEREAKPPMKADLVWTAPLGNAIRSTRAVVTELLAGAEREVLVAGYAFYGADEIFEPLYQRMRLHAVASEFYIHIGADYAQSAHAFWRHTWPWPGVAPRVFFDPRTVGGAVSMHAKCVVVDGRRSFVTSANFTGRAQTENVEVGVVIDDVAFAKQLVAQWRDLRRKGKFEELKRG